MATSPHKASIKAVSQTHKCEWVIGLMSGTSLDGVDAAYLKTDGEVIEDFGDNIFVPYPDDLKEKLRGLMGLYQYTTDLAQAEIALTELYKKACDILISKTSIRPNLIGMHGQTMTHAPSKGFTFQIGDGKLLAEAFGVPVVQQFRRADMQAGGEGAPLVPIFIRALADDLPKPLLTINLGGVSNLTYIHSAQNNWPELLLAWDCGPCNAPINDWMQLKIGKDLDEDGAWASHGNIHDQLVQNWLSHPYFRVQPPKSLDRNSFSFVGLDGLSTEDGAATLTCFAASAIQKSLLHLPEPPALVLYSGGGAYNKALVRAIESLFTCPVRHADEIGPHWNGNFLEARAFAYLAKRSQRGLPLSFPGTTGVKAPQTGGEICY